ncbi:hypothetical protein [Bacillus sp. AFS029533]|uniref:hypothetical protein n=1 Tax=Bacillus sp. AFS029533 TaxID=2033494 RepID=UPI000BFE1A04|nr:hypothetical protein [Bacillus sp. AFS029533]PGZ86720.1 hypothetical protein COE53_21900 [Bacillus sp. AFS029533]
MISIHFMDWAKKRPKKHYKRIHGMRIFELIFSKELSEFGVGLGEFSSIKVFCLANPKEELSFEDKAPFEEIHVNVPYDFMTFIEIESDQEKFQVFSELVRLYIVPTIEKYSKLPITTVIEYVEKVLEKIIEQNYEAVFLVDKTPKKSPSRKRIAILKGIHRSEGFQLRCEVYNEKGLRIIDKLLVEEVGNETVYARFLGTLRWESEDLIVVKSKSSQWMAEIHI